MSFQFFWVKLQKSLSEQPYIDTDKVEIKLLCQKHTYNE